MNSTNKTLYISLYGKALVSRQGLILEDKKAEEIWEKEGFPLKGKAKSRWLAYNMAMRAWAVDHWLKKMLKKEPEAHILHLGCGLDSRCLRVKTENMWYDVDMPAVAEIRRQYFHETENYHIWGADVLDGLWLDQLPQTETAIVVMEGLSMYLPLEQLKRLLSDLQKKYQKIYVLMDVYTQFGVKASSWKNPIKEVGASVCTGIDDAKLLEVGRLHFVKEWPLTPDEKIKELKPWEQVFFRSLFAGKMAKAIYRMYSYKAIEEE